MVVCTIDCVDGEDAGVHPVPDGLSDLGIDGDGPVQVVGVPQQVGGVHPVSSPPPATVIVTILRSRPRVKVYQSLQTWLRVSVHILTLVPNNIRFIELRAFSR